MSRKCCSSLLADARRARGTPPACALERVLSLAPRLARIGMRRADAGDHVLALRVRQPLAVEALLARRRVAREGDAGGAGVAQVAEDHRLDVARGAPRVGDVVHAAVDDGAVVVPRAGRRRRSRPRAAPAGRSGSRCPSPSSRCALNARRATQLFGRELGVGDLALQLLGVDRGWRRCPAPWRRAGARLVERLVELLACSRRGRRPRTSRRSGGKRRTRSAGSASASRAPRPIASLSPRLRIVSIMPGIDARAARAHAHEQRVRRIAERRPDALLDARERERSPLAPPRSGSLLRLLERAADLGRDGEAGRDREAEARHLGEAGSLAAEEIATLRVALCVAVAEEEHGSWTWDFPGVDTAALGSAAAVSLNARTLDAKGYRVETARTSPASCSHS